MAKISVNHVWPHIQRIFGLQDHKHVIECTICLKRDEAVTVELVQYADLKEEELETTTTRFVVTEIIEDKAT